MKRGQSEYDQFVVNRGQSLAPIGLSEVALTYGDAQEAVKLALAWQRSILGGDVYLRAGTVIEPAYANWHVDRRDGETDDTFVQRSCAETERYLKKLSPCAVGKEYLIVIVTGNSQAL